jgi:hypothetical protein
MRTHVIQLESHDDLVSIRDKMSWAKAPRILLVWSPKRRRLRLTEVDLTLLRRHAASLGADLGLVTTQRSLRRVAEHAHIPAYRKIAQAQRAAVASKAPDLPAPGPEALRERAERLSGYSRARLAWQESQRGPALERHEPHWTSRPAARGAFFALGLVSVLALALLFVPSAEIRLQPATKTQSVTLPVTASAEALSVSLSGLVPARVKNVTLSASDTLPASGTVLMPTGFARGTLSLTNLTDQPVSVPRGSLLVAATDPPVRVATTIPVTLPEGPGSTAEVDARALQGGPGSNLPAGSLFALEGPLGLSLSATNAAAFVGGAERRQTAPSEDDRSALYTRLSAELAAAALGQVGTEGAVLFPGTLRVLGTLREDYLPQAGQPDEELSLELEQEFQVAYASQADLETLARAALGASLPPGYEPTSEEMSLMPVSAPVTGDDGITRWRLRASRPIRAALRPDQIVTQVRGRALARARQALASQLLASPAQIRVWPAWLPMLPLIPLRISVDTGS